MKNKDVLQIQMLGGFSLRCGGKEINDQDNRSKKLWILLAYIITFREKELSQNDLVELMWPNEESNNPGNALKTLFHRVRAMLNQLDYLSGHVMVVQDNGTYAWNNKLSFEVDVDRFEALCQHGAAAISEEARLETYLAALECYKGDFLPKLALESWVVPINAYYHTLFVKVAHEAIRILMEQEHYEDVVRLTKKAVTIEPYDEFFYYHLILALVRMGNQQAAMTQYEKMTELFFGKFGVTPSKELTALYKEVVKTTHSMETDLGIIKTQLREEEAKPGAFFCEYEFFKDIYRLQARSLARTGQAVYVGLVTLTNARGEQLPLKILTNAMLKLSDCVRLSLRQGDVYSKYSISQFIVLLPSANYENGKMVMSRISSRFRKENPHSQAMLNYTLHPMEPLA